MSAVLCLPACLCVSTAASRGQAPHGNASVACCLQHQCLRLLRPGWGCAIARIPDAGAPAECGVPRVWCIALRPLYASRNLRRAVVVDEALPAVR